MIFRYFNCLKHFEIYVDVAIVYKNDWYVPGIKDHLCILEAIFVDGSLSSRVEATL